MTGLLNINKPVGITSRGVVNYVQRIVWPAKVGHAGTLDPLASGVLIVGVGQATRLVKYVQRMPKRYTAAFLLGRQSDTEDIDGNVTAMDDAPCPSAHELAHALRQFTGEIQQRPPSYSALKVRGQRAYKLARQGKHFALTPRRVRIENINMVSWRYPEFVIDVMCGSGTYIRALGRDIAESLGTVAAMSALERTEIGRFRIADACELAQISQDSISKFLLPPSAAVAELPSITLDDDEVSRLKNGGFIDNRFSRTDTESAAFDAQQNLVAIVTPRGSDQLRPLRVVSVAQDR